MAELGSHQLDAASIFIAAVHGGQKQHPLSVAAAGNRPLFPADRDCEDHVFCIFEFPAPGYDAKDPYAAQRKIGVQYASINGNGTGGYGETVLGTEGTLLLETEKDALLYRTHETGSKTKVVAGKKKDAPPILQIDEHGDPESAAIGTLGALPAERGYTEELEHWAWCIRNPAPEHLPRCHPKVAMGDAVIALTANMAARQGQRIEFKEAWFDIDSDETPEGVKPDLTRYK
jgi:predicted dehydrogenase